MKHVFRTLLLALSLATFSTLPAQNARQRLTREQLAEKQARHISEQLAMDDKTSQRFIETYCQQQREIWALRKEMPRQNRRPQTDKEAEQAMKGRFERSRKLLELREKYYGIYSKFLTQKQIQRVYTLEKQMMGRFLKKKRPARRQ